MYKMLGQGVVGKADQIKLWHLTPQLNFKLYIITWVYTVYIPLFILLLCSTTLHI